MKTIKEIAESYAQWILRREGCLKSAQLPKVLEGMLKEQRKADTEYTCEWMKENLWDDSDFTYGDYDKGSLDEAISDFRKTMEKIDEEVL